MVTKQTVVQVTPLRSRILYARDGWSLFVYPPQNNVIKVNEMGRLLVTKWLDSLNQLITKWWSFGKISREKYKRVVDKYKLNANNKKNPQEFVE